jgi:hypothetical protein
MAGIEAGQEKGAQAILDRIEERESELYLALWHSDSDAFMNILSADATYIHSTSIAETREEAAAGQRHGVFKHGEVVTVERNTRVFKDVVVTRGVIDMVDTAHDVPFEFRLRQTLIWIWEDDDWRLLVRQTTRLPL